MLPALGAYWNPLGNAGPLRPHRAAYNAAIPHTTQATDPFHVIQLANNRPDEAHRRTQNQTLDHRSRKNNPPYRIHKLLTIAQERLNQPGEKTPRPPQSRKPYEEIRPA